MYLRFVCVCVISIHFRGTVIIFRRFPSKHYNIYETAKEHFRVVATINYQRNVCCCFRSFCNIVLLLHPHVDVPYSLVVT